METSALPGEEIALESAEKIVQPQSVDTAPPPLSESHARIEALAAEIRAARGAPELFAAQHRIAEPALETTRHPEPATPETAPRIELPGLAATDFVAAAPKSETPTPPRRKIWAPESLLRLAGGKRWQIGAIAASLAAIGVIATAGVHERSSQARILAVQSAENESLVASLRTLKAKVDALETVRSRDDSAEMRKAIGEMRASAAGARDAAANVAQLAARFDRSQRDQDARIGKLTEKFDHDSATRNAEIVARLEKLEKKPVAPVVAAVTAPVIPAPGATTLPKQAALLPPAPAAAPVVSRETTGAIARPRPVLHGWVVSDVNDGIATVEGRDGEREVSPGDLIPGAGRVERIERRAHDWAVVTTVGTIVGDGTARF